MSNSASAAGSSLSEPVSIYAFDYRSFVLYWSARFLNSFAIQIVSVAVGWQIYDTTRDPFLLGLVGLVQFAPALVFMLATGTVADRYNRRAVMGVCVAVEALCAGALGAYWLLHTLQRGEGLGVWPVFAILTIFGLSRAFLTPAMQSLAANIVPREAFANAVAWNSSAMQASFTVGPALGGLIYGLSPLAPYLVSFLLFSGAVVLIALIPKPAQKIASARATLDNLLAGVRYIWSQPVMLGAISLDLFAVLLGGATALLPVFARDVLDAGAWGLGLLRSAAGVGALLMGIWLVRHPIRDYAGYVMFAGVALYGLAIIVFGLSTTLWISIPALAVMGAADMLSVNIRATLVQLSTPDDVRGRVTAVNSVFIGASNELGEFRAGTMAAFIGAVPAVVIGGVGTLMITALWTRLFPDLTRTRRMHE